MAGRAMKPAMLLLTLLVCICVISAQVLTPPYFNLAQNRRIEATATCGEYQSSDEQGELFCKLTGASAESADKPRTSNRPTFIRNGQFCDVCDPRRPGKDHRPTYAIDGSERWWQSPPLSRGLQYNKINLTLHLGQEFHVAYVFIKMANSPRPGVFALERSKDYGQTWEAWQYFADTPSDCQTFFGKSSSNQITADDTVICTTEYSNVIPLENGEIVVSLVNGRPSANNFSYSSVLQEWTKATDVRLRLLRTKTLLGHLMAIARQDPTVTRRYFYSIKDISLGGRCVCNGHAEVCDKTDPNDPLELACRCQHNTCGSQCERCCPRFVQKPWRPATLQSANECEPCQCYGHTDRCIFDEQVAKNKTSIDIHGKYEGGGVCQGCRHNTEGINCNRCRFGYYRPFGVALNSTSVCRRCRCDPTFSTGDCEDGNGRCKCKRQYTGPNCDICALGYYGYPGCRPCECNYNGTVNRVCEVGGGQCPCKPNYDGRHCDRCAYGYYGFPNCKRCACNNIGAVGQRCVAESGQCRCRNNYGGRDCGQCQDGFYRFPACRVCSCDATGSKKEICDKTTGKCLCKDKFGGDRCDRCASGYYRYPNCLECQCSGVGTDRKDCDNRGNCYCKPNFAGRNCDQCASGYYNYPECKPCNCDRFGSTAVSCDQQSGQCSCRRNFQGLTCNTCKKNFYNYPVCEECKCNPAGAKEVPGFPLGGCGSSQTGQLCECKALVAGRNCDTCKAGYWNLDINNLQGCEDCRCHKPGTTSSSNVCDVKSGQCMCKTLTEGRRCNKCVRGTYNLKSFNYFGCQACNCDVGGSLDNNCDKISGQCRCRPRVTGRSCGIPLATHFYPSLHHMKYELEDGRTEAGGVVRYGFDNNVFPGYSWRGYAVLSRIQQKVLVDVNINKPSVFRIIFRYVNPNPNKITADVKVTPEASTDVEQSSTVIFTPTRIPKFVTVSGGGVVAPFVLNPGRWTITLKSSERLYADYLVLLPQAYYEATILHDKITSVCRVPRDLGPCRHYEFVDIGDFVVTRGEGGYIRVGNSRERTQLYDNKAVVKELTDRNLALLNNKQTSMYLSIFVKKPGKYILLMQYHSTKTGSSQQLDIDVATRESRDRGKLLLPTCPYSSMCREVVTSKNGSMKIFDIKGTYATLTITGRKDIDVAIDSVIAIPVDGWSVEYLQPKFKCLRKNMKCIDSGFPDTSGTTRIEIETGNENRIEKTVPPHILNIKVKVIKVDGSSPRIQVLGTVINKGPHALVVHYYQPNHAGFDVYIQVTVDGKVKTGKFYAEYCPSVYGCRAKITFDTKDGDVVDISKPSITIHINSTKGPAVWLDYILVIPEAQFTADVLDVRSIDKSTNFITECSKNDFQVDGKSSKFCRTAVFSIVTEYNNGGQACKCNIDGSLSFTCEQFGGQCRCRPNIIGRDCSRCRTGYYGFPRCKPCNCPSGFCHELTGQCTCPPRVTGPNCNVCLPRTFGFDPLIGCEECNCDPNGVTNNELNCNDNTGQCSCKPNIAGRRCNKCLAGYHRFPSCYQCNCEKRGTKPEICDQRTARCVCKENVGGPQCAQCQANTFYLESRNPKGCTKCFCFGATNRCSSSNLRRSQIQEIRGWGVTNLKNTRLDTRPRRVSLRVHPDDMIDKTKAIYWMAPEPYLGNKVTSYGGKLTYTVEFSIGSGSSGLVAPDVRIEGHNMTVVHISPEQPVANIPLTVQLDLLESKFVHESSGAVVSREQFMMLLAQVEAMHIRASYYTLITSARLSDVSIDSASRNGTGELARNVEQCRCPPNYRGTSCQLCAPGYYRSKTGPYLGVCVPCNCHGRATTCDPDTGACINCRDNYGGPQCLTCRQGYYEDRATRACQICSCPLADPANNFATSCEVAAGGIVLRCNCLDGYDGPRCDSCKPGYYGNPNVRGGRCNRCDCSSNIDMSDARSCDPLSGQCLLCIRNTTGPRCERCKDWFYGDAVRQKNCKECTCSQIGSMQCDHRNGLCKCKPNVVGPNCDRCAPGYFGFASGKGCQKCDCGPASQQAVCEPITGQCACQPGAGGRRCDQCQQGYWSYSAAGCRKCQCEYEGAVTCDARTGQCTCMPGVTGAKCDKCLDRWIPIKNQGCRECNNCVHLLLDDVETLDYNVTHISRELESVSVGVEALKRIKRINDTVNILRPQVDNLIVTPDNKLLDPIWIDLQRVESLAERFKRKSQTVLREAKVTMEDVDKLKTDASALIGPVQMAVNVSNDAVKFAQTVLQDILRDIRRKNVDEILRQAEDILKEIKGRFFANQATAAGDELTMAVNTLEKAKNIHIQAILQYNRTLEIRVQLTEINDRLVDLKNNSRHSLVNSTNAEPVNVENRRLMDLIKRLIAEVTDIADQTHNILNMANTSMEQATKFLVDARAAFKGLEREASILDQAAIKLRQHVSDQADQNVALRPLVDNATAHAESLKQRVNSLISLIADTRSSAEGALNASRAYENIVKAINDALTAANQAVDASMKALLICDGLADRARKSLVRSKQLRNQADNTKAAVTSELRDRLNKAVAATDMVSNLNKRAKLGLTDLLIGLGMLPKGGFEEVARQATTKAMDAQTKATTAQTSIQNIIDKLPTDKNRLEQIPLDIDMANRDIRNAQTQVDKVTELVPKAVNLLDRLSVKIQAVDEAQKRLSFNITALRDKINQARGEASRIRVGVEFSKRTTLQVRNPSSPIQTGLYSRLSLFFKTTKPDGFLAYVGPDKNVPSKTEDFMAVEIVGSKINFKYDLGGSPTVIVNNKNVSDGKWHEVIVERTKKIGTVTVRSAGEQNQVAEGEAPGTFSVMDLPPESTLFFVGGVPSAVKLPKDLKSRSFEGCIEEVKFDSAQLGLWDFVYGEANGKGCKGRDVLIGPQTNGFLFDGKGFVKLSKARFRPRTSSSIELKFKTFAQNGLMFLVGDKTDFMTIELQDGKVLAQYDLGSGPAKLLSKGRYNDGKWHTVLLERDRQDGLLKVDGKTQESGLSLGQHSQLSMSNDIWIGGYRGPFSYPDVTTVGFKGCIKDLQLETTIRDLNDNKQAMGVSPGCPTVARRVSFPDNVANGFIALPSVNINRKYEMAFNMKSLKKDGILFYTANDDQSQHFSVSLVDGKIVVTSDAGGQRTVLETKKNTYNDGKWHNIIVSKDGLNLRLSVDDVETVETKSEGRKRKVTTTSLLFFGGLAPTYKLEKGNAGSEVRFVGCIGDVTVNKDSINFASAPPRNRGGALLGVCPIPDPTRATPLPPTFPTVTFPSGARYGPNQCALPLRPKGTGTAVSSDSSGTRFGIHPESRYEYDNVKLNFRGVRSEFSLDFKTTATDGLMFYAANERQIDYIGLYLREGQVNYIYNCGTGPAHLISDRTYNDGQWHTVIFKRDQRLGELFVDGVQVATGRSTGTSRSINVAAPFYVGGLSPSAVKETTGILKDSTKGFLGCIRNLQLERKDFGKPSREYHTQPCYSEVEVGSFFTADGGYMKLKNSFKVGLDLDIYIDIKPRVLSGVILSVASPRGDYLILQLVNGEIIFSVDNGAKEISTTYKPPSKNELCNGGWHSIKAVKAKNVVTLQVNGVSGYPGLGEKGVSSTDTNDPLYIGGIPARHKGVRTDAQYVGCIRNLQLNNEIQNMAKGAIFGKVLPKACPTK